MKHKEPAKTPEQFARWYADRKLTEIIRQVVTRYAKKRLRLREDYMQEAWTRVAQCESEDRTVLAREARRAVEAANKKVQRLRQNEAAGASTFGRPADDDNRPARSTPRRGGSDSPETDSGKPWAGYSENAQPWCLPGMSTDSVR